MLASEFTRSIKHRTVITVNGAADSRKMRGSLDDGAEIELEPGGAERWKLARATKLIERQVMLVGYLNGDPPQRWNELDRFGVFGY